MIYRVSVIILLIFFPSICQAIELGVSTSGRSISLDMWLQNKEKSKAGFYAKILVDFDKYKNGIRVTVCQDGSISGSTGSGTCSGHGGISHTKEDEFDRYGVIVGPSYWITNKIQMHGGLIIAFYNSEVDIGDTSKNDYSGVGIDIGVSFKPLDESDIKIVISYETEQDNTSLGFWYPF